MRSRSFEGGKAEKGEPERKRKRWGKGNSGEAENLHRRAFIVPRGLEEGGGQEGPKI